MPDGFDVSALDDGRGEFVVTIRARAPLSLHEAAKRAAEAEGLVLSEFVRQALAERIEDVNRQHGRAA